MEKLGAVGVGVPQGLGFEGKCGVCEVAKHRHRSFPKTCGDRGVEPLGVVHTDLVGPVQVASVRGYRYATLFVDDFTRFRWTCSRYSGSRQAQTPKCKKGKLLIWITR